jgi:hypothetical protein
VSQREVKTRNQTYDRDFKASHPASLRLYQMTHQNHESVEKIDVRIHLGCEKAIDRTPSCVGAKSRFPQPGKIPAPFFPRPADGIWRPEHFGPKFKWNRLGKMGQVVFHQRLPQ